MYFQFLTEDKSTAMLVEQIMDKLKRAYPEKDLFYDIKSFQGIGHLKKCGNVRQQKTGKLLNDLFPIMRGMGKALLGVEHAAIIVVLDNDKNDKVTFRNQLNQMAAGNMILTDYEFCIAVKETEAWLLGDVKAIEAAYPNVRKSAWKDYEQDGICDTWEVLANAVYPGGLTELKKKAAGAYTQIGIAKCEWARFIGAHMSLAENASPSYQFFVKNLTKRIEAV